jgi:hypothetical protein
MERKYLAFDIEAAESYHPSITRPEKWRNPRVWRLPNLTRDDLRKSGEWARRRGTENAVAGQSVRSCMKARHGGP